MTTEEKKQPMNDLEKIKQEKDRLELKIFELIENSPLYTNEQIEISYLSLVSIQCVAGKNKPDKVIGVRLTINIP